MKHFALFLLSLAAAHAATPISDTVYTANGGKTVAGSYLLIKWPRFTSGAAHTVPPNILNVTLSNGHFDHSGFQQALAC